MTAPGLVAVKPDAGYAPRFAVTVDGQPADRSTHNDVLNISVVAEKDGLSSFDITFNNWDDKALRFKYSESDDEAFALGRRVQVRLGYADDLVTVVVGTITGLRPSFPQSSSPTIGISGSDRLQQLKLRKPRDTDPKYYRHQTDAQIARRIARRHGLKAEVDDSAPEHVLVVQKNQDDLSFLLERAKRIDFDCYIRSDPDSDKDVLVFARPSDLRDSRPVRVFELAYGPGLAAAEERRAADRARRRGSGADTKDPDPLVPNLIEFTPVLKAAEQVSSVTVRAWDPATKQPIAHTAGVSDLPPAGRTGRSGPQVAAATLADRGEVVVDAPVTSVQEARELANALLREKAYQFITGTGRIAGLPQLRPGDNLEIHGLGRRFSGSYFVTRVEHTLGASGFFTGFTVRRIYDGTGR